MLAGAHLLHDRRHEREGLAGAGLRAADDVASVQQERDALLLDRRRLGEAHGADRSQQLVGEPQGDEPGRLDRGALLVMVSVVGTRVVDQSVAGATGATRAAMAATAVGTVLGGRPPSAVSGVRGVARRCPIGRRSVSGAAGVVERIDHDRRRVGRRTAAPAAAAAATRASGGVLASVGGGIAGAGSVVAGPCGRSSACGRGVPRRRACLRLFGWHLTLGRGTRLVRRPDAAGCLVVGHAATCRVRGEGPAIGGSSESLKEDRPALSGGEAGRGCR